MTLLLFFACKSEEEKALQKSSATDTTHLQRVSKSTLTAYDSTKVMWRLKADKMYKFAQSNEITLTPVDLEMYDDTGVVSVYVTADSGNTPESMEKFYLWGHVYIVTQDSVTIRSQSLRWDKVGRRYNSEEFVEIRTKTGERMRGKGFDAAEDFSEWRFYENVDGDFPDMVNDMLGIDD